MMNKVFLALCLWLGASASSYAAGFYVAPELGYSNLDFSYSGYMIDDDPLYTGVAAGYVFDSNVLVELQYGRSTSDDNYEDFDDVVVDEYKLAVGYAIPAGPRFTIIPKAGISHWRFAARDIRRYYDVDEEFSASDNDLFAEIAGQFKINDLMQVYGAYAYNDYGFVDSETIRFGFKFSFNQ